MEETSVMQYVIYAVFGVIGLALIIGIVTSFFAVDQGTVAVVTRFGKYKRVALPGLNFKTPFLDAVFDHISTQNKSEELKFQAITIDQANVHFGAMLLFSVIDSSEEVVKKVAFKFNSEEEFSIAITKTIEGSVRSFVSTKKQSEILGLRKEIVEYVKGHLDEVLQDWGYHLIDLQINDIAFDEVITSSMSQVVASSNLRAAAENQGAALLITKTKQAEAEGNYIKIQAAAEKEAATLRGQGVASFREEVARGMKEATEQLKEVAWTDNANQMIMFSMWTEAIKNFAEVGKGNVIFLDGSTDGMQKTLQQMMGLNSTAKVPNGSMVRN